MNKPGPWKPILLLSAVAALLVAFLMMLEHYDRTVLQNTLTLGLAASCIGLPLGAMASYQLQFRGLSSRVLLPVLIAMLAIPLVLHASSWDSAFGKLGWLTARQGEVLKPIISGWTAATWIHGVSAVPFVTLIFLVGAWFDRRIFEEQASLDAGPWSLFWHVRLPRWLPLVLVAVGWTCLTCARSVAVTDLFQVSTLAEQIYLGYSMGQLTPGTAWTLEDVQRAENLGVPVTMMTLGIMIFLAVYVFMKLIGMYGQLESQTRSDFRLFYHRPGHFNRILGPLLILMLLAIPCANLLARAGFQVMPSPTGPIQTWQIQTVWTSIARAIETERDAFVWSLLIAGCSSILILLTSSILSWSARRSSKAKVLLVASIVTSFAIPGPLWGNLYAWLLGSWPALDWFYNYTIAAPTIANFTFCWPLGCLLVWFLMSNIEVETLEFAALEGSRGINSWWNFGLRQNAQPLFGIWLILFPFCFGELSASRMVMPAGMQTLPGTVLGFMHAGVDEMTAALTMIASGGLVLVSLAGWWVLFASFGTLSQNRRKREQGKI